MTTPPTRTMLIETSPLAAPIPSAAPSLRQGRLEEQLARAISAGCPRSTIREAVEKLVDQLRWQQVPASRALAIVMDVASRALPPEPRVFDIRADCVALTARWATQRFTRAD